jgi:peptidoglycan/LPS O-acetylase OafA/YrhL
MSSLKYRPEIDGLRCLAILPVIIYHSGLNILPGGFLGVDVFFVISGFLISSILMREIDAGTFTFQKFYERRARRILPALLFMMFATVIAGLVLFDTRTIQSFGQSVIAVSVFLANLFFYFKVDYFSPVSETNPLLHMWSLAVEEQFYIFFPVLLLVAVRWRIDYLSLFSTIFVVSLVVMLSNQQAQSFNFYMLHTRAWELSVGAISAYLSLSLSNRVNEKQRGVLVFLGVFGLFVSYLAFDASLGFPSEYALIPVLSAAILLICSGGKDVVSKILAGKPMVYVGLLSYSLYLWHQPVFAFAKTITLGEFSVYVQLTAVVITLLLSMLSYHWVEIPTRYAKLSGKTVLKLSSAAIVLFMVIGSALMFYPKIRGVALETQSIMAPSRGLSAACDFKDSYVPIAECSSASNPSTLVWGDSYAMHLVNGLAQGLPLIQATKNACSPVLGLSTLPMTKGYDEHWADDCLAFNHQVFEYLKRHTSVKTVVISSTFEQWLHYDYWNGNQRLDRNFEVYKKSFEMTVDALLGAGKRIVLVSPPPKNGRDIGQCLSRIELKLITFSDFYQQGCNFPKTQLSAENRKVMAFLSQFKHRDGIQFVDLTDYFCKGELCSVTAEHPLYLDAGHLNDYGSHYVASFLQPIVTSNKQNDE